MLEVLHELGMAAPKLAIEDHLHRRPSSEVHPPRAAGEDAEPPLYVAAPHRHLVGASAKADEHEVLVHEPAQPRAQKPADDNAAHPDHRPRRYDPLDGRTFLLCGLRRSRPAIIAHVGRQFDGITRFTARAPNKGDTQRRRTEQELRLLHRSIAASNSITISDSQLPDEPLIYVNRSFERMIGYSREEALGRTCRFLQSDDRDQPALLEVRAAFRDASADQRARGGVAGH